MVKNLPATAEGARHRFDPWVENIPWSRKWQPTPVCLPGKFHEQRRLAGYSPWSSKESEMTEHTHNHFLSSAFMDQLSRKNLANTLLHIGDTSLCR